MLYLALISPLVVLGFLLTMQLFEAWVFGDDVFGDDDRPRGTRPGR